MHYTFPCAIEGNEYDGDGFVVTFPDVYGANTGGETFREAIIMAEDCLVVSLGAYMDCQEELPTPGPWTKGQELITVQPLIAAQLDLYTAMREQGITTADLAQRLDLPEAEVKKLLVLDYRTPIGQIVEALEAVGRKLVVEDRAA
jgi:predicted RNase H-like HicB family nuclease